METFKKNIKVNKTYVIFSVLETRKHKQLFSKYNVYLEY